MAFCLALVVCDLRSQITTVTTSDTSLCIAAPVQLQTTPSGGTSYSYSWSPATGLSSTTIANPVASPTVTTTYTVTVTDIPSSTSTTDNVTITIQNVPPPIEAVPQADTICADDTISLDVSNAASCASFVGGCITSTSTEEVGNGQFTGVSAIDNPFFQQNFAPFFIVRGNKRQLIYTRTELNNAGIVGPTNFSSLSFSFNAFASGTYNNFRVKMGCTPNSVATSSFISGLSTVVYPKTISITSSGWKEFVFDEVFSWDGTSNIVIELCFFNPIASTGTPGIQYDLTTGNFCTYVTDSLDVCANTTGTAFNRRPFTRFKYCDLAHASNLTYTWSPTAGLSSGNVRNPMAYPSASTNYILTVTDSRGCYKEDTVDITVVPTFNLTINPDTTLCRPDTLALFANNNAGPGTRYKWNSTASILVDSIQNTQGVFNSGAEVSLRVTSMAGCEKSDTFSVDMHPPVDVEMLTLDTSICAGDSIPLEITTNAEDCTVDPNIICPSSSNLSFPGNSIFSTGGVAISPFDAIGLTTTSGQKKQYLFLASELASMTSVSNVFNSLGFNMLANSSSTNTRDGFTIRIGCTSASSFNFTFPLPFEPGTQTVFTPKSISIQTGWNDFQFDTPFVWDGTSNVIVEICWENSANVTGITTFNYSITTFTSVKYNWNSGNFCSAPNAGTITTARPEMRLGYCQNPTNPAYQYLWTPSAGLSNDTSIIPMASPATNTSYVVEVVDPASGCSDLDTVQVDVATAFNLNAIPDTVLCQIDTVQLEAVNNSTLPVTYKWLPASSVSNPTIPNPLSFVNGFMEVVSEVKSSAGCIRWDTVTLGIKDQIDLQIQASISNKCEGDTLQLQSDPTLACGLSSSILCNPLSIGITGPGTSVSDQFNITPFVATTESGKKQLLLRASELNTMGLTGSAQIGGLSFEITNLGLADYKNFRIKMRCTNSTQLSSTFMGNTVLVFSPKDVTLVPGVNWFDFDNRFNWDGQSNLLIEICYVNASTGASSEIAYNQPNPVFSCNLYDRGPSVCGSSNGSTDIRRPVMGLKYCNYSPSNLSYNWEPNILYNDPGLQNPIGKAADPGIYKLTLTDPNSNCNIEDSVMINVSGFEIEATEDTTLCSTKDFQLLVVTDAALPTYSWSPANDVSNSAITNPIILVDNGYQFIIEVTDSSGCINSDTVNFNILPRPTVSISNDMDACRNANIQLMGGGGVAYNWTPVTGLSNPQLPSPVANVKNSTTYYLEVTGPNGCTSTDSVRINIYPSPILDLGPDTSICIGGSLLLNAGKGFNTYTWNNNSTDSVLPISKSGKYWVKVNDNFNCEFTDTVQIALERAIVTLINLYTDVCIGDSAILDAGNSGSDYSWNTGATSQKIIVKDSGFYKVNIDNGKCKGTDSTNVRILEYPVSKLPPLFLYCNNEFPFGKELTAGPEEYSYRWNTGHVLNTITVDEEGNYKVEITNGTKCSVTDEVDVRFLCQEKIFVPNSFTPNSDGNNDIFEISALNIHDFEFHIYNRWGNLIFRSIYPEFQWDGTILGQPVPNGAYVWKLYYKTREIDGSFTDKEKVGTLTILR